MQSPVMNFFCGTTVLLLCCVIIGLNGQEQVVKEQFDLKVSGYDLTLYLTLPYAAPSSSIQTVLFLSGFKCRASWYQPYVDALVKEGYAVIQYDKNILSFVDDITELGFFNPIRNLLLEYSDSVGIQLNLDNIALAGHSRGGKLALLLYSEYPEYVSSVYLIDPVDSSEETKGEGYPSAVQLVDGLNKTMGIAGAGISGSCNPEEANYLKFWQVADKRTSILNVIEDAGHMQFCLFDHWTIKYFVGPLFNVMCQTGETSEEATIAEVLEVMIPWIKKHFEAK